MKIFKLVIGFVPFVSFSILVPHIGAGWAAAVGLAVTAVVLITGAREGVNSVAVAAGVVLLAIMILGLLGGSRIDLALVRFGPTVAALLIGAFMIVTATRFPFTAQAARLQVPPEFWHRPHFLQMNRRISTGWGLAVLFSGICSLAATFLADQAGGGSQTSIPVIGTVVSLAGFYLAARYTHRVIAQTRAAVGHPGASQASPAPQQTEVK